LNRMVGVADYFGMTASTLCLLHCLGLPLLLSVFPLFGLALGDEVVHQYMAVMVTLPVVFALIPGFVVHRRWLVLILGGFGLACFIAAVLFIEPLYGETAETVLAMIGGAHLFVAHLKNRTFCRSCAVQHDQGICSAPTCSSVTKSAANGN
jgi:hypothetical protein